MAVRGDTSTQWCWRNLSGPKRLGAGGHCPSRVAPNGEWSIPSGNLFRVDHIHFRNGATTSRGRFHQTGRQPAKRVSVQERFRKPARHGQLKGIVGLSAAVPVCKTLPRSLHFSVCLHRQQQPPDQHRDRNTHLLLHGSREQARSLHSIADGEKSRLQNPESRLPTEGEPGGLGEAVRFGHHQSSRFRAREEHSAAAVPPENLAGVNELGKVARRPGYPRESCQVSPSLREPSSVD